MQKKVFIIGASRGIGKALAIEYAKKGGVVTIIARNENDLKQNVSLIEKFGGKAYYKTCDVSDREQVRDAIDFAATSMNGIDIAILNAGVGGRNNISEFDSEKFVKTMQVNLFGATYAIEYLIPIMTAQRKGIIAGVGSLADARSVPGAAAYSCSKIALSHLLETARIELKANNIRVVSVKPGFVRTDMTAKNNYYMPFMIEVEKAAKIIIDGIENGMERIYFPLPSVMITYLSKILPSALVEKLIGFWAKRVK